jgi:hypothetical protein
MDGTAGNPLRSGDLTALDRQPFRPGQYEVTIGRYFVPLRQDLGEPPIDRFAQDRRHLDGIHIGVDRSIASQRGQLFRPPHLQPARATQSA